MDNKINASVIKFLKDCKQYIIRNHVNYNNIELKTFRFEQFVETRMNFYMHT